MPHVTWISLPHGVCPVSVGQFALLNSGSADCRAAVVGAAECLCCFALSGTYFVLLCQQHFSPSPCGW